MKIFLLLFLVGLSCSAPVENKSKVVIDKSFFPDSLAIYTSEHDIVDILVPLNGLNFGNEDETKEDDGGPIIFFIEADVKENGNKDYKGLYVLKNKEATKLLHNGKDFAASADSSKNVFFGTDRGIYTYNAKEKKAEKYGTISDDIIGIAKENGTDHLYILDKAHDLFKVIDNGNNKERISQVTNAQQIVMDYENHLYWYDDLKKVYVLKPDGSKVISGLPENPSSLKLIRPPFIITDAVFLIADDKSYTVFANGTSELSNVEIMVKPTAIALETALIQYYGYEKKIYEYNILVIIFSGIVEGIQRFFDNLKISIEALASKALRY